MIFWPVCMRRQVFYQGYLSVENEVRNHVNLDMRDRLIGENSRMAGILHYLPACSTQRLLCNAILRNNEKKYITVKLEMP